MGNKLLIRASVLVTAAAVLLNANITINDIDRLVNDIKQERIGLKDQEIIEAKDPFIYPNGKLAKALFSTNTKRKRYRFVLTAIVNDRVKINRRWYRLNSTIHGFKVSKVGRNYVLLTRNDEKIRVFLRGSKNKKIKLIVK